MVCRDFILPEGCKPCLLLSSFQFCETYSTLSIAVQRLHTYDWAQFNKERQYLQWQVEWSPYVDLMSAQNLELPVEDTESLLDSIEDMELLRILSKEDRLTLEIILYKLQGYTSIEIAEKIGLTEMSVRQRISRLKKKF